MRERMENEVTAPHVTADATRYTMKLGPIELSVDPTRGARIARFALDGQNVLAGEDAHAQNWGSTFWPSPQSTWGWPPIATLDSSPYDGRMAADDRAVYTSGSAPLGPTRVTVTKAFSAVPGHGAIAVEYAIRNDGPNVVSVAPWEITRVRAGGISFFALGPGGIVSDQVGMTEIDGVAYYANDFEKSRLRGDQKSKADGVGWLAHVDGDLLFVKSFADVLPHEAAPDEAEIEIYAGPHGPYVEIEPQGAFRPLAPGATVQWTVRWFLCRLPPTLVAAVGNRDLVDFVRTLIA